MPEFLVEGDQATLVLSAEDGRKYGWGAELALGPEDLAGLVIDCSELRFVVPPFLLRLRALIDWQIRRGTAVRVLPPKRRDLANYLARMHIAGGLPDVFGDLPVIRERERGEVLVAMTRLHDESAVDRLNEDLGPLLMGHFDDVAALADPLHMAIGELCGNAVTHGASPEGCYVAAQRYEKPQRRTVLAIGDLGVGIPEHMRTRYPELRSDEQALQRALELAVSATGDPHRGNGFYWVMETAANARVSHATLDIRSGFARVRQELGEDGAIGTRHWVVPHAPGTWVRFELGRS